MNEKWLDRLYRTFPALSYRNFRLFWFGQAVSLMALGSKCGTRLAGVGTN